MFKLFTYFVLPLCLVQAVCLNKTGGNGVLDNLATFFSDRSITELVEDGYGSFCLYSGLNLFLTLIGSAIVSAIVYSMMQTYNEREERLQGIILQTLNPLLFRNIKKLILVTIVSVFLISFISYAVMMTSVVLNTPILFYFFPIALIAVIFPFFLWMPIYVFEKISLFDSLAKAFRLGFATWGGIFLIVLIMGIIATILQTVASQPWSVASMVKSIFAESNGGEASMLAGYDFFLYLLAIIQAFGTYLSTVFAVVGLAYQYGHASEKMDNVTVLSDIDNFNKL